MKYFNGLEELIKKNWIFIIAGFVLSLLMSKEIRHFSKKWGGIRAMKIVIQIMTRIMKLWMQNMDIGKYKIYEE